MSPTKVSELISGDCVQKKSIMDEYQWSLPKDVEKVARNELREDENSCTQGLLAFRQWISKNSDVQNINIGMITAIYTHIYGVCSLKCIALSLHK